MNPAKKAAAHKNSRGSHEKHLDNFFDNFSRAAVLMHRCLQNYRSDQRLLQEATRNYTIALVSCLETYFRDLCVFICEKDVVLARAIFELARQPHRNLVTNPPANITPAEIGAACFNFQSTDTIDQVFAPPFGGPYFRTLENMVGTFCVPARGLNNATVRLEPGWRDRLEALFEDRHRFIHDANFESEISNNEMAGRESLIIILTQLTSVYFCQKYGSDLLYSNTGEAVLLLVEDLISEDWKTAEDFERPDPDKIS